MDELQVYWLVNSAIVFVICVLMAGVLIPQILLIAFRRKLFDEPDERKIHRGTVPRLGGIAFKPVVFLSIALVAGVDLLTGDSRVSDAMAADLRSWLFAFCAIMILYLIGMADDLIGIRYRAKFVVQVACGVLLIAGGVWINDFFGVLGIHAVSPWAGWPLTVLFVVFLLNAVNLIDGLDGLCSSLCGVTLFFYGLTFFWVHEYACAMFSFAVLGVLVPFFYYNVYGSFNRRRKIFMGDTGSLTVGFVLCFLSVKFFGCMPQGKGLPNAAVVAWSPLIIPCFDVVRVYLHRVRRGKNPFLPDRTHIHHKLLAVGMRQRQAMGTIVGGAVLFALINIAVSAYVDVNLLLLADILLWTLLNGWLTKKIRKRGVEW